MERFAHPHENNIAYNFILFFEHMGIIHYLGNDFTAGKITLEPKLTCGTEHTSHGTTSLSGDAQRASLFGTLFRRGGMLIGRVTITH